MKIIAHTSFFRIKALILFAVINMIVIIMFQFVKLEHIYVIANKNTVDKFINPLIDTYKPTKDEIINEIRNELPQLPYNWNYLKDYGYNKTCAQYPSLKNIMLNNQYWQTLITTNGTFYFFGAYFDDRLDVHYVRVLGMFNNIVPNITLYSQLWFDDNKKVGLTTSGSYNLIWHKEWGINNKSMQPYLISFQIPSDVIEVPVSISLVENICDRSTTNLRINYNKPNVKKDVAVCVKGLDFLHEDISLRLMEWIELLHILGADKIFFYNFKNHHNITKILDYYKSKGMIDVTPLTLPGYLPNTPSLRNIYLENNQDVKRRNELIPYNDCFYKHMYEYKFIAVLDIDEVIVPKYANNWSEFLENMLVNNTNVSSFCARNAYFLNGFNTKLFKGIPEYMHILQNVYRTYNYTKPTHFVKCFHDTNKILTLHNHYPVSCLDRCLSKGIDVVDGQLNHYRADCVNGIPKVCEELKEHIVEDFIIWKHKDELISRVKEALNNL